MTFYETMAALMKEKGLNATDLSKRTGIPKSYFSKLKSGHMKDVTWEKAVVIIAALGTTPDEFYRLQNKGGTDE